MDTPVIEIEHKYQQHCERCLSIQTVGLVKRIFADGGEHICMICLKCGRNINYGGGQWISHEKVIKAGIKIEDLPVIENGINYSVPCARCGALGTQYHHWAPRHLFDDADEWPGDFLCQYHHIDVWHARVTPNMRNHEHL